MALKQAIRSNSSHSILKGFQQEGNDQTQPCVLLFRDSDGVVAFMFARIQYNRIQYVLKPFKMPANWLTTLKDPLLYRSTFLGQFQFTRRE
jgi:hypothetical protein